jgi:hypothetical protein
MSKLSTKLIVAALLTLLAVEPTLVSAFTVNGSTTSNTGYTNTSTGVTNSGNTGVSTSSTSYKGLPRGSVQSANTSSGVAYNVTTGTTQNYQRVNTSTGVGYSTGTNTTSGGSTSTTSTANYQSTNTSTGVSTTDSDYKGLPDSDYDTDNHQTTNTSTGVSTTDSDYKGLPGISACNGRRYPKDIDGHWAEIYIRRLYDLCIVEGYNDGRYRPNQNITRAELVKMALYAKGIKPNSGCYDSDCGSPFMDLDSWQGKWIRPAWDKGIIEGYSYDRFRPNKAISRAEAVKVILATYNIDPVSTDDSFFNDVDGWSVGWIEKAHNLGIVQGIGNGNFDPNRAITRAEAAKVIAKMVEKWDTHIK